MQRVKQLNLNEDYVKQLVRKRHKVKLDNLLNSNEYERVSVESNGDCFFKVALI